MNRIPTFPLALATMAGLWVAGCGGGGTTVAPLTPDSAKPISVSGVVLEKDGETTDLAGIRLLLVESGESAVTGADGAFAFRDPQPGSITLRVRLPASTAVAEKDGADAGEDSAEDEFEDDDEDEREESSEDGVRVEDVQDGESVRIRIRIEDGQIVETRTSRSDGGEREVEIRMTRSDTNDDPDMKGEVELESRTDREKFETEVEHADPDRGLELFVIDPAGTRESQGVHFVGALGEVEWELDTQDGDRLPFAASSVDELVDHAVEVRDSTSGALLLSTVLGEMPTGTTSDDGGGDDSGSESGGDSDRLRGRARLTAIEPGLDGTVEVRRRPDENRERFQIEVEHLAPGRVVELLVEDPGMPDAFLSLGSFAADSDGEVELERDTNDGDLLPGNVATVEDLAGLDVEVRDGATDALLLTGIVPLPVLDD